MIKWLQCIVACAWDDYDGNNENDENVDDDEEKEKDDDGERLK